MTLDHPEVKNRITEWQEELRRITGNPVLILVTYELPPMGISDQQLIQIVCEEVDVSLEQIRTLGRSREVVAARQVLCYYLRTVSKWSFVRIGKFICKDHSTAIHSINKLEALLQVSDHVICSAVLRINKRFEQVKNSTND